MMFFSFEGKIEVGEWEDRGENMRLGQGQGNQLPSKTRPSADAPWNFLCECPRLDFSMKARTPGGDPRPPQAQPMVKDCLPSQDLGGTEHRSRGSGLGRRIDGPGGHWVCCPGPAHRLTWDGHLDMADRASSPAYRPGRPWPLVQAGCSGPGFWQVLLPRSTLIREPCWETKGPFRT
ncbi:Ornithine Carbamoyltransferase [Manis pentadactyla]|nr:Ornithine Carbamoyltransferase [Manis pentadactyla]